MQSKGFEKVVTIIKHKDFPTVAIAIVAIAATIWSFINLGGLVTGVLVLGLAYGLTQAKNQKKQTEKKEKVDWTK